MDIIIIVAKDKKGGIGVNNTLPWKLSDDLKAFRSRTLGHHIVMGRKTYMSIGRPLPGRTTIVVSRRPHLDIDGCDVVSSPEDAYALARSRGEKQCFVIGGGELYAQCIKDADALVVTEVEADVQADTFFPVVNTTEWREESRQVITQNEKNEYNAVIRELVRV